MEGKFPDARCAVTRHDEIVPPLHHTRAELVLELGSVDQQERGAKLLRLPRKQGQCCLETTIAHACCGRQPDEFQGVFALMMDDPSPGSSRNLNTHVWVPRSSLDQPRRCNGRPLLRK